MQVDGHAARRYLELPGELGHRLRQALKFDPEEGHYFEITDRRCPMWRTDGLCQIQAQLGHEGLCRVCREFPRLRHDYGDFVELGLELSCPEAARLILSVPAQALVTETLPGGEPPEYDPETMEILLRTREKALALLASGPVPQALKNLLLYGHQAQGELDGEAERPFNDTVTPDFAQPGGEQALLDFFAKLELLTPRWEALLRTPAPRPGWPEELRAMARYGVERYWLQAVSDWDLSCRVKLIVSGCILVRLLGGDPIQTAQLWSKEIENSAENVEAVLDGAYTAPALTDSALLGLLT